MKKMIAGILAAALIVTSFVFPTEIKHVEAALTTLPVETVNSPTEVFTKGAVASGKNLVTLPCNVESMYSFTLNEDGWFFVYNKYENYICILNVSLYNTPGMDQPLKNCGQVENSSDGLGAYANSNLNTGNAYAYYLSAGTYYIKLSTYYNTGYVYSAFLPASKVVNKSLIKEVKNDCASATIRVPYEKTGTSQMFASDIPAISETNQTIIDSNYWGPYSGAVTSATDTYTVTSNGTYTFRISLTESGWSNYPVMVKYTVKDLPGHSVNEVVTKKATPTTDGTYTYKCSTCGTVTNTKKIAKISSVTLSSKKYTFNGKTKKPGVTVKDSAGNVIPKSNYSVVYSNNKNIGKAKVTVTFKGNTYSGKVTKSFTIVPGNVKISGAKPSKKTVKLTWKGSKSTYTGYEITYKSASGKKITKTVKGGSKKTYTVKGLTKNRSYTFKIRAYKKVSGKTYYSKWTSKTVRTQK